MEIPDKLYYSREHEWASVDGNRVTVGITDYAQGQLGDIVYIELPVEGDRIQAKDTLGVIESVKAVSDIYAPISGEILEVNQDLMEHPEWVNQEPYDKGWMLVVAMEDAGDLEQMMDAQGYEAFIAEQEER
jgi:glycine cleavage system H protein